MATLALMGRERGEEFATLGGMLQQMPACDDAPVHFAQHHVLPTCHAHASFQARNDARVRLTAADELLAGRKRLLSKDTVARLVHALLHAWKHPARWLSPSLGCPGGLLSERFLHHLSLLDDLLCDRQEMGRSPLVI